MRLSVRGLLSMVMAEAGGKEGGRDGEVVGGTEDGMKGNEWTAMEDMLFVYWCCTLLGRGWSELDVRTGIAA